MRLPTAVTEFVLDNSVVCGWLLPAQSTPYTHAVRERLDSASACVPALWELELTNLLRTTCLRQRLNAQQAQQLLVHIGQMPITVDRQAVRRSELLALALRFGLTAYDAAYLELALRRQLPIATLDNALASAAMASGVGLVVAPTT